MLPKQTFGQPDKTSTIIRSFNLKRKINTKKKSVELNIPVAIYFFTRKKSLIKSMYSLDERKR